MLNTSYRNAFFIALGLHLLMVVVLLRDNSSQHPTLVAESQNKPGFDQPLNAEKPQPEIVKAVSVDSKAVTETIKRIKNERVQQHQAELNRQKELDKLAENAKQQRIKEQQQIARLKEEANKLAVAHKKQAEEEKKHLKQLAEQKILEAKRIQELKKQQSELLKQQAEAKKQELLNKTKVAEQLKAAQNKIEQERIAKERVASKNLAAQAEQEKKAQAQATAAQHAEQESRIAGEVDKYKALIVNAIGRNWILPENVSSNLSSQFRIRLAPNGMVLEVTLTRSSGDALLDRSAQTAIYKASPLPVPTSAEAFNMFRDISLTVRPEQVRG